MASEPSHLTATSSASPAVEEILRVSFAVRRYGGSAFPVSLINMARPSMCHPASAASKRPGSSKTGRGPTVPKADVSAGISPRGQRLYCVVLSPASCAAHNHERIHVRSRQCVLQRVVCTSGRCNCASAPNCIRDAGHHGIEHAVRSRVDTSEAQARHANLRMRDAERCQQRDT